MRVRTVLAALALTLGASAAPVVEPIRESEIAASLRFLTSPELEGRGAAERGGAVASAFLAVRLLAEGWLPAGDLSPSGERSFFQTLPAVEALWSPERSRLAAEGGRGKAVAAGGTGPSSFLVVPDRGDTVRGRGEIVFAGFGIRAPEYGHDDYAGIDPKGKVVLVLSGEPQETDPQSKWNGTRPTRHAVAAAKARLAGSLGAVALLVAPNPAGRARSAADLLHGPGEHGSRSWLGLAGSAPPLPVLYVDPLAAEAIAGDPAFRLERASADLEAGHGASRTFPRRDVLFEVAYESRREVVLRNVVARLGAARGLDGDVVVVGAHWDHLGAPGGTLHPGADDNASGVAALLEVAAALRASPPRAAREVILGFWTGEERGRLGSTGFLARPPVPLDRISCAVNLDGLGRPNLDRPDYAEALQIIYSAAAPTLREVAAEANAVSGFDLRFHGALRLQPVSDHYTFFEAGIPVLYPFSGYHADYHLPSDTVDRLDLARIARSARFVARLIRLLAERPEPIRLDPSIREAPPPDPFERP